MSEDLSQGLGSAETSGHSTVAPLETEAQAVLEDDQQVNNVEACVLAWLAEQKRLEDFRFIEREVRTNFIGRLRRAVVREDASELENRRTLVLELDAPVSETADQRAVVKAAGRRRVWGRHERRETPKVGPRTLLRYAFESRKAAVAPDASGSGGVACRSSNIVDIHLLVERRATPGASLASAMAFEFHGRATLDAVTMERRYRADYEEIHRMQVAMVPSLPRPILFLELLLALPLEPDWGAASKSDTYDEDLPFRGWRLEVLEDMLAEECWAEESESELLEDLTLEENTEHMEDESVAQVAAATSSPVCEHAIHAKTKSGHKRHRRLGVEGFEEKSPEAKDSE